jgi:cell division protein FtsN
MKQQQQRGGTAIGFILGLVIGLGAALAVAVYVTKVPVPFVTGKGLNSGVDRDAAEQQKNKSWDPNTPLQGKNPARPATPETTTATATGTVVPAAPGAPAVAGIAPAPTPVAAPTPVTNVPAKANPAADPNFDPLGDLARAKSKGVATPAPTTTAAAAATAGGDGADPFQYFVQAGAFRTPEDAEAQRAKLAMSGLQAKVTEREQSGRTVYRVRMGPFGKKDDAEQTRTRLEDLGTESALVRVQR